MQNALTRRAALFGLGALASAGLSGLQHADRRRSADWRLRTEHRRDQCRYDTADRLCRKSDCGLGSGGVAGRARQGPRIGRPWRLPLNVRIDTLYLGGGGPADPDSMRGVATLGGRTINVYAVSTYFANPTDQALPEQALQGRVQDLAVAFAYRVRKKMRGRSH